MWVNCSVGLGFPLSGPRDSQEPIQIFDNFIYSQMIHGFRMIFANDIGKSSCYTQNYLIKFITKFLFRRPQTRVGD